jgi:hypothetical protein
VSAPQRFPIDTPAAAMSAAMTPGAYMRGCRRQAGMTIQECADAIALHAHDRTRARADIIAMERNRPGDYGQLVRQLRDRRVFAFDFGTFAALAEATSDPSLDPWAVI